MNKEVILTLPEAMQGYAKRYFKAVKPDYQDNALVTMMRHARCRNPLISQGNILTKGMLKSALN